MDAHDCKKIVFSSSATVYGTPQYLPLDEDHPVLPVNPYGHTKLMVENILKDWAHDGSAIALYISIRLVPFSGALAKTRTISQIISFPILLRRYWEATALKIFGDDYETRDGTGERDYIHVTDQEGAYCSACGYECGVRALPFTMSAPARERKELLAAYGETVGRELPFETVQRRLGDVASSVASPKKANEALNWSATLSIHDATSSSWLAIAKPRRICTVTRKYKITVVGTGYVGMSMTALLGQHNEVIALDIDSTRVALINQGKSTVVDADIQEFLDEREPS